MLAILNQTIIVLFVYNKFISEPITAFSKSNSSIGIIEIFGIPILVKLILIENY